MADTKRTIAQILALAPNNDTGQVSPQDLRDIILTLLPTRGSFLFNTPAETDIGVQDTWYKVAGGTVPLQTSEDFSFPVDNRIQYIGEPDRLICLWGSGNMMRASGSNQECSLAVAKNGVPLSASVIDRNIPDASSRGAVAFNISDVAAKDDYYELWTRNRDSTNNITVDQFNLFALALPI